MVYDLLCWNSAPKNVSKRIFHITCNDDPQQKSPSEWFKTAETNAKVSNPILNYN